MIKRTKCKRTNRRSTQKGGSKGKFDPKTGKSENLAKYVVWGSSSPAPKKNHLGRPSKSKLNAASKAMTSKSKNK
jgi:hypothetical protein